MNKKDKNIKEDTQKETNPGKQQETKNAEMTDKASAQENKKEETAENTQQTEKPEVPTSEEIIGKLEKQLSESTDKYLRLFSEFDNFRKRSIKERLELTSTASAGVITALLPVLDDLERASKLHAEDQQEGSASQGIQLIYNKFKNILSQKGVQEIKTIGENFDTDYHDAITHIPATDENQKGKIIDEVQKGYTLNDKVIRFARVVVAN